MAGAILHGIIITMEMNLLTSDSDLAALSSLNVHMSSIDDEGESH